MKPAYQCRQCGGWFTFAPDAESFGDSMILFLGLYREGCQGHQDSILYHALQREGPENSLRLAFFDLPPWALHRESEGVQASRPEAKDEARSP